MKEIIDSQELVLICHIDNDSSREDDDFNQDDTNYDGETSNGNKENVLFNIINTNARSICPK